MKIFITGGTGFIGFPLVKKLLGQGHDLMVLTRKSRSFFEQHLGQNLALNLKYVQGDVSTPEVYSQRVLQFKPELIYHLIWEGIPDHGPETSMLNLEHGLRIYQLAVQAQARALITSGSCFEYGAQGKVLQGQLDEQAVAEPRDCFTAAKTALRFMGHEIAWRGNCDFIWARLFYVYGPRQRAASLVPAVMSSVMKGVRPEIKTPFSRNDFTYVQDVVEALASFAAYYQEHPEVHINGIYNIGSGQSTSVQEMVAKVGRFFGHDYPLRTDLPEEIVNFWADTQKLERLTGWKPQTSLDEGIKEVCQIAQLGQGNNVKN